MVLKESAHLEIFTFQIGGTDLATRTPSHPPPRRGRDIDMTEHHITRRNLGTVLGTAAVGFALPTIFTRHAYAADTFREGLQIGAMGALRTTLPGADKKYDLAFDAKDFRDSTSVLLAIEQGELEIGNTTTQHLIRAISENIPVRWVCGWAGGYNVLVSRKGLNLKQSDAASLKSLAASRKQSGNRWSSACRRARCSTQNWRPI